MPTGDPKPLQTLVAMTEALGGGSLLSNFGLGSMASSLGGIASAIGGAGGAGSPGAGGAGGSGGGFIQTHYSEVSSNNFQRCQSLFDPDLDAFVKFDKFLKLLDLADVKDLYKNSSELELILEKHILKNS